MNSYNTDDDDTYDYNITGSSTTVCSRTIMERIILVLMLVRLFVCGKAQLAAFLHCFIFAGYEFGFSSMEPKS